MRSIYEAAWPREDVLSGELRDEVFAAQLEEVAARTGERVYTNPDVFFANTFPTNGLRSLLSEALGRIAQGSTAPIIRLETAFGGGKTHALIALYHLAANQARPRGIENYVDPGLLPDRPVRVAAVVGNALDPIGGVKHSGATTYTLWGELAYQLGAYEQVARADTEKIAPGVGALARVFESGPVVVMLDELARHLTVGAGVTVGDSTLADQTVAFLMALLEYAASVDDVVVVYTLASSADAFSEQTEKVLERIRALKDADAVSSRHEHVITPTGENEISAIVRHRLFERVDDAAARETAAMYHRAIVDQIDREADLPAHAAQAGYAKDIRDSFPLHPELLTGLNEKVSTIPNFQKTRGALRLLSRVVRKLWTTQPEGTFLIHPHHVDLAVEGISNDLTSRLDRAVFKQVIEADIANPMAGAKAHAALVDEQLSGSGKPAFAARMATTVFIHSLVQGVASGLSPTQAKLAVYTPGDDVGLLERQTDALLDRAFYLHFDGNRYRFSTEPSLTAVVNQEKQLIGRATAKRELDRRIRTIWKQGAFTPVFFPAEPSEIDDTWAAPRLAVIHYDEVAVLSDDSSTPELVKHLFDRAGTAEGFRIHRNHVVFLCADAQTVEHAVEEARRYLAINRIVSDLQRFTQYTKENQKRLKALAQEAELILRVALTRLYRVLHKALTADERDVSPAYLLAKAWPANSERATPRQLQKEYAKRIGLPILFDINKLKETIRIGVRTDKWVYFDPRRECGYSSASPTSPLVEISDDVELVRIEAAEGIPICGQQKPATAETCPLCQNLTNLCTCGTQAVPPSGVGVVRAQGSPAEALQRIVDLASDQRVALFSALTVRSEGSGQGFLRDLQAITYAVPQLPKAKAQVDMAATFQLKEEGRLRVELSGPWNQFQEINNTTQRTAKHALDSTGRIQLHLTFPTPIKPEGREISSIRDTLVRLKAGRLDITATPYRENT